MTRAVIAIVGRSNVGKSTLFNRLLGRRMAVVSPRLGGPESAWGGGMSPRMERGQGGGGLEGSEQRHRARGAPHARGTTRDRLTGLIEWRGVPLVLMDTGGFELVKTQGLAAAVQAHVRRALQEADGLILLCDAHEGLVPADEMILEQLRKTGKPILLVANKADDRLVVPPEFFSLGVAEAYPVSALHGRGIGELLDHLVRRFSRTPQAEAAGPRQAMPAIAIVGRQNVGKSSLLNALLREERVIVSDVPGTTRDAIDTCLTVNGEPVLLIDTAGLRHRRKVRDPVDHFAMSRTLEAIERCDVALVVLDATQGLTRDDQRIVAKVCEAGRGLVLLLNKWDLVRGGRARDLADAVSGAIPWARFAPVLAVSATTGFHVAQSLQAALRISRSIRRGIPETACRSLMEEAWKAHPPPRFRGRAIRLVNARWLSGRPARVELVTRPAGWLARPYQHYLLKRLHAHPQLSGIPISLVVTGAGTRDSRRGRR